jgi:hypothetical protein
MTVSAVVPTSTDPRFASENFTAGRFPAIVTVAGRLIAPFSRNPLLLSVGTVAIPRLANDVVLLAETGTAPGLPKDSAELRQVITQEVTDVIARPAVTIHSPGRFAPPKSQQ